MATRRGFLQGLGASLAAAATKPAVFIMEKTPALGKFLRLDHIIAWSNRTVRVEQLMARSLSYVHDSPDSERRAASDALSKAIIGDMHKNPRKYLP